MTEAVARTLRSKTFTFRAATSFCSAHAPLTSSPPSVDAAFARASLGFHPKPEQGLSDPAPGPASAGPVAVCPLRGQTERGDLFFGGTSAENVDRIIVPWANALAATCVARPRLRIRMPSRHDMHGDGFARTFRERQGSVDAANSDERNEVVRSTESQHFIQHIRTFFVGRFVSKRSALPWRGYVTAQHARDIALRRAPGIDLGCAFLKTNLVGHHSVDI